MSYVKFATESFSASFPSIHQPDTTSKYPSGKYEVTGFLDEAEDSKTLETLRKAIHTAADAQWPGVNVDALQHPLKTQQDGTVKVRFKSKDRPATQDASGAALDSELVIGRGDLIRVAGNAKAYDMGGSKGVTLYLNTVRLIDKRSMDDGTDDPFGGPDDGFSAQDAQEPEFM